MGGTTTTSVLCADRPEDIQQLIESINTYRNEAATDELRRAFRNDVDPNGNPYGYDTLTGQRSNNMQHGVTWSYANGIYNDTAEIISMAAVYYQQDWPSSQELAAFTDDVPFTQYCRALTAYGMEITARESAPYSCISYGGCVNGYRSEGETVTITEYRCETHTCAQGNEECGHYHNGIWEWSDDHAEGSSHPEWIEDGTHDVTVFFPVIFPDGATQSELCALPDNYTQVVDGKIAAEDCTGSIVLDESANLYKGELNDWFYAPNERTATFTVETTDGDETMTKDYTVTFANATAIPWCPGEADFTLRRNDSFQGGWFWRANEDHLIFSTDELLLKYETSVGRNTNMLLGLVIDKNGLVPDADVKRAKEFGDIIRKTFSKPIRKISGKGYELSIRLNKETNISRIVLSEDIAFGERVLKYKLKGLCNGKWIQLSEGSCIGHKRIEHFPTHSLSVVKLEIEEAKDNPVIKSFAIY